MNKPAESDLYQPVKALLEKAGYVIRGEVGKCDMVGYDGKTLIAVELKLIFGLGVIYQALNRLSAADLVYVATLVPSGQKARANFDRQLKDAVRLCRLIGIGFISVRDGIVTINCEPGPYQPRKTPKLRSRLLSEFSGRTGDFNTGGTTRRPRVTVYRENALRCAVELARAGQMAPADLRKLTGVENAGSIVRSDVYGWFHKIGRGSYMLAEKGHQDLKTYADVVASQAAMKAGLPLNPS